MTLDVLDELSWRGLLHQATDPDGLREHLATGRRTVYNGFDPTADSLTVGNLVAINLLVYFQRAGHRPVVVMGGGTGLIGDPSGKEAERVLMSPEQVASNVEAQRPIFERLLGSGDVEIVNNLDWLEKLGFLEVLRDIGKHFSVNVMIQRDAVRDRLHAREQGISYTEFSYAVLQSYDFLRLHLDLGVTVQSGGSDQWGNIVSGVDLVRRVARTEVFGVTAPLLVRADGTKFGKSEGGDNVWLTAARTSPYAFYQFWLNTPDDDVARYLKLFTLYTRDEIESLEAGVRQNPAAREAQRALARDVTGRLHGPEAVEHAERAARALFTGDVSGLDAATIEDIGADVGITDHRLETLDGEGADLVDVLVGAGVVPSRSEARRLLASGGVSVNGGRVGPDARLTRGRLLDGDYVLLRKGKKDWHVTRWR